MSERDDDAITRQRTLVANAEEMAREHSARREIRMREDRVRHLGSEAPEGAPPPKKPRPVEPSRPVVIEEPVSDDKKPRLSDPFPPLGDKRQTPTRADARAPSKENEKAPAVAERDTVKRQTPSRTSNPAPTRSAEAPRGSGVDELAIELEEFLRRSRIAWAALEIADKATLIAAIGTIGGVFSPWVSTPARPYALGIVEGGVFHLLLAALAIALVVGRAGDATLSSYRAADRTARRASLYHVLLGALSTFVGAGLLLYWGALKSPSFPLVVHAGFYWTLAMGTGLSYGGFARFGARRR